MVGSVGSVGHGRDNRSVSPRTMATQPKPTSSTAPQPGHPSMSHSQPPGSREGKYDLYKNALVRNIHAMQKDIQRLQAPTRTSVARSVASDTTQSTARERAAVSAEPRMVGGHGR